MARNDVESARIDGEKEEEVAAGQEGNSGTLSLSTEANVKFTSAEYLVNITAWFTAPVNWTGF